MIYDQDVSIYILDGPTPLNGTPTLYGEYYGAEQEVFHKRYWEAVQAGYTITNMVQIPGHIEPEGDIYVKLGGERWYRVEQLQRSYDDNGLPVTVLSLSRSDRRFDILGKE